MENIRHGVHEEFLLFVCMKTEKIGSVDGCMCMHLVSNVIQVTLYTRIDMYRCDDLLRYDFYSGCLATKYGNFENTEISKVALFIQH